MDNLGNILKKINIKGRIAFNEPMSKHTTYETGGPADIFTEPENTKELLKIIEASDRLSVPHFILGKGANILVSDNGIRGIVISTGKLSKISINNENVTTESGLTVDHAAETVLESGLSGFDAFYGMPGTIGGAVWMNARCYGLSISDILVSVKYLDENRNMQTLKNHDGMFSYKKSPFQGRDFIILESEFRLKPADKSLIAETMKKNRLDRENKGHYAGPSAGSVFKNNRDFGKPSGAILDSLGLRGTRIGGSAVSDKHANIFINKDNASSTDIYNLIKYCSDKVYSELGLRLEPEVQFIGDFS